MKYLIVFEDEYPGLAEHSAPLAAACLKSGQFDVTVATAGHKLDALKQAYAPFVSIDQISFTTYEKWNPAQNWQAMISTVPGSPGPVLKHPEGPIPIPRIGLTHGLTDKVNKFPAHFPGHPLGYFNVMFASGPSMFKGSWEQYLRKHPDTESRLKVMKTGAPKTDLIVSETFDREAYINDLGLSLTRKTVLYAPTYQQEASLEQFGTEIIEQVAKMDVNVLVKLHHCSLQNPTTTPAGNERYWVDIIQEIAAVFPNLRFIQGEGIPAFRAADLMIGDASGASFEFILQNKPIVFIDVPRFFAIHGKEGIGYWGRYAGPVISNLDELPSTITDELEHPANYEEKRIKLCDELVYNKGHALDASVQAILDLIEGRERYPAWGPEMNRRHDTMQESYIISRLQRVTADSAITALYGAGAHTTRLLELMQKARIQGYDMPQYICILDDNAAPGQTCNALPVISPEKAINKQIDTIILSTDTFQKPMKERCASIFGPTINTIDLYEKNL